MPMVRAARQGQAMDWQKSLQRPLLLALLLWPWLNPFAPGPSPQVLPLLTAWVCLAGLLLGWQRLTPKAIAAGWLLAGLISTLIALCQNLGIADLFAPWMTQADPGNVYANLRQRNQFASLTSIALMALFWFVVQAQNPAVGQTGEHAAAYSQNKQFWAVAAAAVFLGVGNALSSSRTGLVQLVFLTALLFLWPQWRLTQMGKMIGIVWVAYAFGSFVLPVLPGSSMMGQGIFSRFATESLACASRRILWANVLDLIGQKPWFGWGWGELDYAHFVTLFSGPRFCEIADNAHNLPLQLAVELGVPLALLLCGTLVVWLVYHKPWKEAKPSRQLAWGVLMVIGLHSLLEYPLWYGPFQMAVVLCGGLLWHGQNAAADSARPGAMTSASLARAAAAMLALMAIGFAMVDYHRVSQIYLPVQERSPGLRHDTLRKIADAPIFQGQVQFAELTLTPLTAANAAHLNALAHQVLHFSPEARVAAKLIESATLLGKQDEAAFYTARFKAAFPEAYQKWQTAQQ